MAKRDNFLKEGAGEEKVVYAGELEVGGEFQLVKKDIDIKEPLLDLCVTSETSLFGCGEFGLREYELNDDKSVKGEFSLIGKNPKSPYKFKKFKNPLIKNPSLTQSNRRTSDPRHPPRLARPSNLHKPGRLFSLHDRQRRHNLHISVRRP